MEMFNEIFTKFKKSLVKIKNKVVKSFNNIDLEKYNKQFVFFTNKIGKVFLNVNKSIIKVIKRISKKIKKLNDRFYDKVKISDEIVYIVIPCLFTLVLVVMLKSVTNVEVYSIAKNQAEVTYYEGNYDLAIEEYNLLQENETWPIYSLELSNIYSMKQEFEKSESILKESIIIRDRINNENSNVDNKEIDEDFINKILFIFNMNKNYEETITLGEQYLLESGISNKTIKNIFTAYLSSSYKYKSEELLSKYIIEEDSAVNRAELANMNGLLGDFDKSINLLNEAFNINPNEILIYDTIEELVEFNSEAFITALESKSGNEISYKFMLAKAYSLSTDEEYINKAKELYLELSKEYEDNYILSLIAYSIYKDVDYLEEAYKNSKDENEYLAAYLNALYKYKTNDFEEAKNEAYKSIVLKGDYNNSYILLADIMNSTSNIKSSESYLREALEVKPYSYKTIIKIADLYSNILADDIKARYYFDIAINIRKDDSSLYYKIVKLDISNEDYNEAISNLNKAIQIDPNNSDYYRVLGVVNFQLENYEEGIEETRNAYLINENDVLALNNAAWFYINIERDVLRGYENIKSAFEDMPLSISEENKKIIIESYNRIKSLYESGDEEYTDMDLKLIY